MAMTTAGKKLFSYKYFKMICSLKKLTGEKVKGLQRKVKEKILSIEAKRITLFMYTIFLGLPVLLFSSVFLILKW